MPLKLPQKWQSKRQWKKLVIWYKIRLQKKLAKVASTLEDKKKSTQQERCLWKYANHQKSGSKLLMNLGYCNHKKR